MYIAVYNQNKVQINLFELIKEFNENDFLIYRDLCCRYIHGAISMSLLELLIVSTNSPLSSMKISLHKTHSVVNGDGLNFLHFLLLSQFSR